jgi:chemotaxis family two-component system sensor kinase Cph1
VNYLVDYEEAIPMPPAGSESKDRDLLRRIEELTQANEKIQLSMYALAHDLTVPLRATRTYTELLLRRTEGKLDEESVQIPGNILRGLDRMKRLIHDVLEVAKASDPDVTTVPVDTRAVAQLALQNLRKPIEKAGAMVSLGFLPMVYVNEEHTLRLFENLLGNAIKYRSEKRLEIDISASRNDQEWIFSIRDNGIGIAPAYHNQIFEMFKRLHSRSKYDGSGLGLAVCKRIIQSYNGRIWVESDVGEGSTFYFTISTKWHASGPPSTYPSEKHKPVRAS